MASSTYIALVFMLVVALARMHGCSSLAGGVDADEQHAVSVDDSPAASPDMSYRCTLKRMLRPHRGAHNGQDRPPGSIPWSDPWPH